MVSFFTRMSIAIILIVVIAEGVEYWRSLEYPEQQWAIVPVIMFFTILALISSLWFNLRKYKISG